MRKLVSVSVLFWMTAMLLPVAVASGAFVFDEDAEIKPSLSYSGEYRLSVNPTHPYVYFRDPENPSRNLGTYNWKKQYWESRPKDFDTKGGDLQDLFVRVRRAIPLDRMKPASETVYRDLDLERKPYEYSNDKDFADFVAYLQKRRTSKETMDFYLMAANNPAKRGRVVAREDADFHSEESSVGIQADTVQDGLAGGMQYYFELHRGKGARETLKIVRDSDPVPLTVVELDPQEGFRGPAGLRGEALVRRVEKNLETAFGKDFDLKSRMMTISYKEALSSGATAPLTHLSDFMAEHVDPKVGQQSLVLYYFTDTERLRLYDEDLTHPLQRGAYGADWARRDSWIIHELGHALGLHHHFSERSTAEDLQSHVSPACIMNYQYHTRTFCELCRYALGIDIEEER